VDAGRLRAALPDVRPPAKRQRCGYCVPRRLVLFEYRRFKWVNPAFDGAFIKLHFLTKLLDAQALGFGYLRRLSPETCAKDTPGFSDIHLHRHLGLKKPTVVSF
jgi:hypothetical protein